MPSGKTRVAVFALIGLTALLVGFQGASTLMTLTQIGASPGKPSVHASLVPRPAIPLEVSEPARIPAADVHAATPTQAAAPTPNVQPVIEADPVAPSAADTVAAPTSNLADLAAAATAQAQLVEAPAFIEEAPPRRERRRYRAVRPDLHRVY